MAELHRVFLLPGFFGFTQLGEVVYFGHVRDLLVAELARRGVQAEVFNVVTHPTSSILLRARAALVNLQQHAGESGPIHLIGHSTGGLDARLLVSPGADLGPDVSTAVMERVRSVVTVSTPHRGTPLATFFNGLAGQQLLRLLSAFTAAVLRRRVLPTALVFRLIGVFLRADDWFNRRRSLLDQLFSDLLSDFSDERRTAVAEFLSQVGQDQALMTQLTPDAMELFHATTRDRPGVRYGSVITRAPRPTLRTRLASGFSPYAQLTHTLFTVLYGRAGKFPKRPFHLDPAHAEALRKGYGIVPARDESDGIVPTLSQPYGQLLATLNADHLDGIGHFEGPDEKPPHYDWLTSGAGFDRQGFEDAWTRVVSFLVDAAAAAARAESHR